MSDSNNNNPIVTLLSFLYTNHVFLEFRQPVLVTYPEILNVYLSKITNPIDLGTLLTQALQNELTIDALRQGLQSIVANALTYNAGYPLIEAISRHLEMFSKALFEEIIQKPYEIEKMNQSIDEFQQYLWKERKRRYFLLQSLPLNSLELTFLQQVLRDVALTSFTYSTVLISASNFIDAKLEEIEILRRKLADEANAVTADEEQEEEPYDPFPKFPTITLHEVIQLILKDISDQTSSSAALLPSTAKIFPLLEIFTFTPVKKYYGILEILDNALGIFLTRVEERFYRGASFCTRWSIPHEVLVWAPLPERTKNKPWVPGMILVSNSPLFPMSIDAMEKNIQRFPKDFVKELMKCRPRLATPGKSAAKDNKAATSNGDGGAEDEEDPSHHHEDNGVDGDGFAPMDTDEAHPATTTPAKAAPAVTTTPVKAIAPPLTSLGCPDGYVLIEFFGEHDLAWMKADICAPMDTQGKIPKFSKTCSQAIFEDAEDIRLLIEKFYASHGEYPYDGVDLTSIPELETIQAAVTLSEELKQAISNFHEKGGVNAANNKKRRAAASSTGPNERKRSTAAAEEGGGGSYFIDGGYYSEDHLNNDSEEKKPVARKRTPSRKTMEEGGGGGGEDDISPMTDSILTTARNEQTPTNGGSNRLRTITRKIPEIYDKNRSNLSKVNTPSKLLPKDFHRLPQYQDRFIVQNKLFISRAPLPVPIDTSKFTYPLPGYHFKFGINFRRNATLRCRALAMYLNQIKPLNILENTTAGTGGTAGDEIDELDTTNNVPKRGRKTNQEKAVAAAAAAAMTIDKLNQKPVFDLSLESLKQIPIHEFFDRKWGTFIESGCSRFYYGKGLAFTRIVDFRRGIFCG